MGHIQSEASSYGSKISDDSSGATSIEHAGPSIICIKASSSGIGLGVFAETNIRYGALVFQERPVFEAIHDSYCKTCLKDGPTMYRLLSFEKKALMQAAFRPLADADHVPLSKAYEMLPEIGKRVRPPTTVKIDVNLDQYISSALSSCEPRWPAKYDAKILKFVKSYAFRSPEEYRGIRHGASVFLIGSLINHKCSMFNCNFSFQDGEIRLIARVNISKGEELSINYGSIAFDCLCEECVDRMNACTHHRWSCILS